MPTSSITPEILESTPVSNVEDLTLYNTQVTYPMAILDEPPSTFRGPSHSPGTVPCLTTTITTIEETPQWGDWGYSDRRDSVHRRWHLPSLFGSLAWTAQFRLHLVTGRRDYTSFYITLRHHSLEANFSKLGRVGGNPSSSGTLRRNSLQLLGCFLY